VSRYVCPNGHDMPEYLRVECRRGYCAAKVIYEPSARVLELERALNAADSDLEHTVLLSIVEEARKAEMPGVITLTEHGLACAIGRVVQRRLGLPT
jgi:hypothetical protein